MEFEDKQTAKISAQLVGMTNRITIDGTTGDKPTPENAATQINKLLDIVGQSVSPIKMTRTVTQEAIDNG